MSVSDLLENDRYAIRLGVRLIAAAPGRVVLEMDVDDHHLDRSGRVSGGVLFSLADCALGLISNASATAVAVATHMTIYRPEAVPSRLRAEIHAVSDRADDAVTFRATLTGQGAPIAHFTGTTLKV